MKTYNSVLPEDPPSSRVIPPDIRAKILADQALLQQAGSTEAPIYNPGVGIAKMGAGFLAGIMQQQQLAELRRRQQAALDSTIPSFPGDAPAPATAPAAPAAADTPDTSPSMPAPQLASILKAQSAGWADSGPTPAGSPPSAADSSSAPLSDGVQPPSGRGFAPPPMNAPQLGAMLSGQPMPPAGQPDAGSAPTYAPVTPPPVPMMGQAGADFVPPPAQGPGPVQTAPLPPPNAAAPPPQVAAAPAPQPTAPTPSPAAAAPAAAPAAATPGVTQGAPMDRATFNHWAAVAKNPDLPVEMQQQAMQMLVPRQMQREDGSVVMYDPVKGTQTQIMAPTEKWEMSPNGLLHSNLGNVRTPDGKPIGASNQTAGQPSSGYNPWEPIPADSPSRQNVAPGLPGWHNKYTGEDKWGSPDQNPAIALQAGQAKENYDQLMAEPKALASEIPSAQKALVDLHGVQMALDEIEKNGGTTGVGSEQLAHWQSAFDTAANSLGLKPFNLSNETAMQSIRKFSNDSATAMVQQMTKDDGPGSRFFKIEFDNLKASNANPDISPDANRRIVGIAAQWAQRKLDVGTQLQDYMAEQAAKGQPVSPTVALAKVRDYDAAHPIVDPLSGKSLSSLPRAPGQPRAAAQAAPAQAAPPAAAPPPVPAVGAIYKGHRFLGGDPSQPASWAAP